MSRRLTDERGRIVDPEARAAWRRFGETGELPEDLSIRALVLARDLHIRLMSVREERKLAFRLRGLDRIRGRFLGKDGRR